MLIIMSISDERSAVTATRTQKLYIFQKYTIKCNTTLTRVNIKLTNLGNNEVVPHLLLNATFTDEGRYRCLITDSEEKAVIFNVIITLIVLCK